MKKNLIVRYFRISAYTGYAGETNDYYVGLTLDKDEDPYMSLDFMRHIDECTFDNALEWYDDIECEESFDEYYEECGASYEEISKEEFEENMPA